MFSYSLSLDGLCLRLEFRESYVLISNMYVKIYIGLNSWCALILSVHMCKLALNLFYVSLGMVRIGFEMWNIVRKGRKCSRTGHHGRVSHWRSRHSRASRHGQTVPPCAVLCNFCVVALRWSFSCVPILYVKGFWSHMMTYARTRLILCLRW